MVDDVVHSWVALCVVATALLGRVSKIIALAGIAVLALAGSAPAGAQAPPAAPLGTVVVVHGLEDFPADVYLDGATTPALSGFEYRRVTDALALPAGEHRADIRRVGEPFAAPPALSGSFTVTVGQRITVAALLDSAGKPSWLAFPNDAAVTDPTQGELRFRHFAATGPATVVLDGKALAAPITNLAATNPVIPVLVPPGTHTVAINDTATGATLVGSQQIEVGAGSVQNLYLTGKASSGRLGLLQEIPPVSGLAQVASLQVLPSAIPSGDSGLLAHPASATASGSTAAADVATVAVLLLAAAASVTVLRRRQCA